MLLFLDVPYEEKDQAKALGAKWCPEIKKWYVLGRENYAKFSKWIAGKVVVCDHVYIVEGAHTCDHCGEQTKVIGLGFDCFLDPHDIRTYNSDGDVQIDKICSCLPRTLAKRLIERYNLKQFYSRSKNKYSYMNFCGHCSEIQSNYSLFEEVDSPFFVDGEDVARKLLLHKIQLPHDICVNSAISDGSVDTFIKKYAKIIESDLQWGTEMLPARLIAQPGTNPKEEKNAVVGTYETKQQTNFNGSIVQPTQCALSSVRTQWPVQKPYPWSKTLLLAVFFGWIGAHRIYVDKYGTGILYLLTLGMFGIGWIADIVRILKGSFKDKQGRDLVRKR